MWGVTVLVAIRGFNDRSGRGVLADEAFDGVAAESPSAAGGEQRLVAQAVAFGEPDGEDGFGVGRQGHGSLLSSFAFTAHVRAGAQADVTAGQSGELGDP